MRRTAALLTSLLVASLTPLAAQQAVFVGVVTDSLTRDPLAGASVLVLEQGITAATDERGRFELDGVTDGDLTILIQRLGYRAGVVRIELVATRAVRVDLGSIALSPMVTELSPVVVEAEELNLKLRKVGFFRRMGSEKGTFLTREDIAKQNPARTSDLLRRIPGFRALADGSVAGTRGIPSMRRGFSSCGVDYYIDGVHADGSDIDVVIPTSIDGMEMYTGSASIPPAFRITGNPRCGVVVIWTREGGRSP